MAIFLLLLGVLIMIISPITAKGACLKENIPFGETAKYEHWIDYLTDTAAASDAAPYIFAFKMEIYNTQDNSLIQKNNVNLNLSIEKHDTIRFEDINGDGSLEMNLYTLYETDSNNTEEYHNDCWTWNREKGKMVNVIPITVQKGDCLWKIAAEYYNNGNDWGKIYEWNHSVIGDNPSLIYEGMKLNLP